jgi:mRNA-degrading endonuclease toxin of MazEF toxin-antitoxin module
MKRGDVVLAMFPHASGTAPKSRPVLVVQADYYNQRISNVLVASITTNLRRKGDAAHFLVAAATPEGKTSGLTQDSLVSCLNLAVMPVTDIGRKIGELSGVAMQQIDICLKAALGIP